MAGMVKRIALIAALLLLAPAAAAAQARYQDINKAKVIIHRSSAQGGSQELVLCSGGLETDSNGYSVATINCFDSYNPRGNKQ